MALPGTSLSLICLCGSRSLLRREWWLPKSLRVSAIDANAHRRHTHKCCAAPQPSTYFVYGRCKNEKVHCRGNGNGSNTNNQWQWGGCCVIPVTNIGMPTLAATSMVPDTVVPPLSFCIMIWVWCNLTNGNWTRTFEWNNLDLAENVGQVSSRSFQAGLLEACQQFQLICSQTHVNTAINYSNCGWNSSLLWGWTKPILILIKKFPETLRLVTEYWIKEAHS